MSRIKWDETTKRFYETGVSKAVLYPQENGIYPEGFGWNGLISISENPSGADASPLYANNAKYLNLISQEEFGATIQAYTYPDEFEECDGSKEIVTGLIAGQQPRKPFGLSYVTNIGNDTEGTEHGYKLHLVYGATAKPSQKDYQTINNNPDSITFSWEIETIPVTVPGFKPTSVLTINSLNVDATNLAALEEILYGKDAATGEGGQAAVESRLPLPAEIITILSPAAGG